MTQKEATKNNCKMQKNLKSNYRVQLVPFSFFKIQQSKIAEVTIGLQQFSTKFILYLNGGDQKYVLHFQKYSRHMFYKTQVFLNSTAKHKNQIILFYIDAKTYWQPISLQSSNLDILLILCSHFYLPQNSKLTTLKSRKVNCLTGKPGYLYIQT